MFVFANINNRLDPVFPADITGVDTNLGRTALSRSDGKLIIKMDVSYQR